MTAIDANSPENIEVVEKFFWGTLRATLYSIFDANPALADRYRRELMKAPPFQRVLALHDDPLDVASTLTGASVTSKRAALYDELIADPNQFEAQHASPVGRQIEEELILARLVEENSPPVPLRFLNGLMSELGYSSLAVRSGRAFFDIERRRHKTRHLPQTITMASLPGATADREQVYTLHTVMLLFDSMLKYARRKKASNTMLRRIDGLHKRVRKMFA